MPTTTKPRNKRAVLMLKSGLIVLMGEILPEVHEVRDTIEVEYAGRTVKALLALVENNRVIYREMANASSRKTA